jgi:hypothetical protein
MRNSRSVIENESESHVCDGGDRDHSPDPYSLSPVPCCPLCRADNLRFSDNYRRGWSRSGCICSPWRNDLLCGKYSTCLWIIVSGTISCRQFCVLPFRTRLSVLSP